MSFFSTDVNPLQSPLPPTSSIRQSMQHDRSYTNQSFMSSPGSPQVLSSRRAQPSQYQRDEDMRAPHFSSFIPGQSSHQQSPHQMSRSDDASFAQQQQQQQIPPPAVSTNWTFSGSTPSTATTPPGDMMNAAPSSSDVESESNIVHGVQRATKVVDQCISRDEVKIDLMEQLKQMDTVPEVVFEKKHLALLPEPLFEQYSNLKFKCFMGLFTEIHRAWVTIDNKFFIWSFLDGGDFTEFDELDQVIISVGLVKPKKSVFKDFVKYLLVLATPIEVILVAVTFSDTSMNQRISSAKQMGESMPEISLLPTNYSVSSDNVNMLKICGTENGRIFLCGQDGCLYELTYEAEEGWFRKKCRKLNHTQSIIGLLVPNFMKFTTNQPIIDITVDRERNVLYTLSEDSLIDVYDLGEHGNSMLKVATLQRETLLRGVPLMQTLPQIVYISPIGTKESRQVQLVAISTSGDRYYFSIFASPSSRRPNSLVCVAMKALPDSVRYGAYGTSVSGSNLGQNTENILVQEAFFDKGVFVMADARLEGMDTLYCIALETMAARNQTSSPSDTFARNRLSEMISKIDVQGKTLAIGEVQMEEEPSIADIAPFNELARQYLSPSREFVCLSNNGIVFMRKFRPVDTLQQLLQQNDSESIRTFVTKYGADEACAMFLMIACSVPNTTTLPFGQYHHAGVSTVENYFFEFGGTPSRELSIGRTEPSSFGGPVSIPDVYFSPMHNAFYLLFARLIRPFWRSPIFVSVSSSKDGACDTQVSTLFSSDFFREVETTLLGLKSFFERHPHTFTPYLRPDSASRALHMHDGRDPSAGGTAFTENSVQTQQHELFGLYHLNSRSLQVLAFIEILKQCNLQVLLRPQWVPEDRQRRLLQLKFKDFATQQEGEELMKDLVRLIVDKGSLRNVERLTENLEVKCSSFFNRKDILEIKAFDLLQQAQKNFETNNIEISEELADKSLRLYSKIADSIRVDLVCRPFQKMQYYTGCVDLALTAAKAKDPNNLALDWTRNGRPAHDIDGSKAFQTRKRCYESALAVLEELDMPPIQQVSSSLLGLSNRGLHAASGASSSTTQQVRHASVLPKSERERMRTEVITRMLKSDDELFYDALFTWMKYHHREAELLEMNTSFLESYLQRENDYNLLWQYYEKREKYDKAAKVLVKLAEMESSSTSIETRIHSLSKAVINARLAAVPGSLLKVLEDKLEVARAQGRVLSEMHQMMKDPNVPDARKDALAPASAELNRKLIAPEQLYNDYAHRFKLYESCLIILHCTGYKDVTLIQKLWKKVISRNSTSQDRLARKLRELGYQLYDADSVFFPLDYLIATLERYNFEDGQTRNDSTWIIRMMREVGVPFSTLYFAYYRLYLYLFENHLGSPQEHMAREQFIAPASVTTSNEVLDQVFGPSIEDVLKFNILCALTQLLDMWFSHIQSPLATWAETQEFPEELLRSHMTDIDSLLNMFVRKDSRVLEMRRILRKFMSDR